MSAPASASASDSKQSGASAVEAAVLAAHEKAKTVAVPNPDDRRIGDVLKLWTKAVFVAPTPARAPAPSASPATAAPASVAAASSSSSAASAASAELIGAQALSSVVGAGGLVSSFPAGAVVIVGFPYDEGCRRNGGRPGACDGPRAFRQLLRRSGPLRNAEFGLAIEQLTIVDSGDVVVPDGTPDPPCAIPAAVLKQAGLQPAAATAATATTAAPSSAAPASLEAVHAALQARVTAILSAGAIPFVVGGSNDQSFPNAMALIEAKAKDGAVGVVNIDAHLDVRPLKNGRVHSGSPFRCLLEEPRFDAVGRFVEFAAQGNQCSLEHADYVQHVKAHHIVWLSQLNRASPMALEVAKLSAPKAAAPPARSTAYEGNSRSAWLQANASDRRGEAVADFAHILRYLAAPRAITATTTAADSKAAATAAASTACPVFVSFDIDSVCAADCPGVSAPGSLGLTASDALGMSFVSGANPNVALFDMSEFNPQVEGYVTAKLAAGMFYYFCMGVATRHTNAKP